MSSACLVFLCALTIWVIWQCFQRVIWRGRGQGIRQNFDILLCRMDTFLLLRVLHFGFEACWSSGICCFLFIQASISACFFCSSTTSCDFLICLSSPQDYSWHWRYSSLSWVLLIESLWRNTSSNTCLASFIMQKRVEACGCLFLSGWYRRVSLQ